MSRIFYTQPYLSAFAACSDTVLKTRLTERLASFENQIDQIPLNSSSLRYYTSNILVMKYFGAFNSRVILHRKEIKKTTFLFARLFFDQAKYTSWRREIEPEISSGLWELRHPLSKKDIEAAYEAHKNEISAYKKAYFQKIQTRKNTDYILDWCEQDWFIQQQYKY